MIREDHISERHQMKADTVETEAMDHVLTEATIESLEDLWAVERRLIPAEQVRRATVPDALVHPGTTLLSLPTRLIRQLGLEEQYKKRVRSSMSISEAAVYDPVRLTIQGRTCTMDVMEVPDDVPVLIGQLPLGHLNNSSQSGKRRRRSPDGAGSYKGPIRRSSWRRRLRPPIRTFPIAWTDLDFVIDMRTHSLIDNPAHGGEHMYEL
jgi:hypothetical protein